MDGERKNEVYLAALAGLLHDVGKFAQRADAPLREIADSETRRDVKYEHALASYSFVQDYAGALPAEARRKLSGVAYHHAPKSNTDEHVRLADWLSAGERDELDGSKDDQRVPYLRSIFSLLHGLDVPWYLPLKRLHFTYETLFPQPDEHIDAWQDNHHNVYFALWEQFEQACKPLKGISDPVLYLEMVYQRLFEFTWCIPSAYYNAIPDVSLYDHARMTAALAACLVQDERDGIWCRSVQEDDEVAVLVAGDISGVQDFIYTLASAGAAKTLRGRSFYLQLLTEVVADFLLRKLGLPPTNLIYAGGGNFYLLVGVKQQDQLEDLSRQVTQRLITAHRGALHLTLAWMPLKQGEFRRGRFAEAWRRLQEDHLLPAKHHPMAALPETDLFELVGKPLGMGGDNDHCCSICGAERQKGEHFERDESGAELVRKCELCQSFEKLGNALATATHFVWLQTPIPSTLAEVADWQTGLNNFGVRVALLDAGMPLEKGNAIPDLATVALARVSVLQPTSDERIYHALRDIPVIETLRPLARMTPLGENRRPLTFDQLAKKTNLQRWGVLRMDVDNLGMLFQHGFKRAGEDNLTLSRLATLSLSLRLFFEGWLPNLANPQNEEDSDDLRERLYLQYAGGDDLFIVGAWDALPCFAERVRLSFAKYVCQNPKVTLSGGISLADEHYPLYQAARDAHEAERAAKGLREAKNGLTFLGQSVAGEQFAAVMCQAYELADWCENRSAPKSLIQTLIEISAEYERSNREGKFHFGRWMWMLIYELTRAAVRVKDQEVKEGVMAICKQLLMPEGPINTLGLAARWAEFLSRSQE